MHKLFIGFLVFFALFFSGCALLNRIVPSSTDEQGNVIPGTHELTDSGKSVAANFGVYGELAVGIPLLVWNFVERFRRKNTEKGLMSTVVALKSAFDDVSTQADIDAIKSKLSSAHKVAGVEGMIKNILAKI